MYLKENTKTHLSISLPCCRLGTGSVFRMETFLASDYTSSTKLLFGILYI